MRAWEKWERILIGGIAVMITLVATTSLIKSEPVPGPYVCSLCGEPFNTIDELYQHFVSAHPAEPVTIKWE